MIDERQTMREINEDPSLTRATELANAINLTAQPMRFGRSWQMVPEGTSQVTINALNGVGGALMVAYDIALGVKLANE